MRSFGEESRRRPPVARRPRCEVVPPVKSLGRRTPPSFLMICFDGRSAHGSPLLLSRAARAAPGEVAHPDGGPGARAAEWGAVRACVGGASSRLFREPMRGGLCERVVCVSVCGGDVGAARSALDRRVWRLIV